MIIIVMVFVELLLYVTMEVRVFLADSPVVVRIHSCSANVFDERGQCIIHVLRYERVRLF